MGFHIVYIDGTLRSYIGKCTIYVNDMGSHNVRTLHVFRLCSVLA